MKKPWFVISALGLYFASCASVTDPQDVLNACLHELKSTKPNSAVVYADGGGSSLQDLYSITLAGPYVMRDATRDSVNASVVVHSPLRDVRVVFGKRGIAWKIASVERIPWDSNKNLSQEMDPVMNSPAGGVSYWARASYGDNCEWSISKVTPIDDSTSSVTVQVPDWQHREQEVTARKIDGTWRAFPPRFFND